ncbi:MAG TPA: adenylyltransferase/cytidyltransferase family protein [Candidatus Saccharimonadales bacterium]|nr:adenylyltransferase/cytidyltransferase family protein [Candidatus Saccharimonadales bacterium]
MAIDKKKIPKKPVVVAVSGYFNPLHVGHLDMIKKAKKLGDKLIAIVNNDIQVKLKGSVPFMSEKDRVRVIGSLRDVDEVFLSIDKDKTQCRSLAKVKPEIFANGGDRYNINDVPEYPICQKLGIKMVDGLGKKIRASSEMIARAAILKSKKTKPNVQVKSDRKK